MKFLKRLFDRFSCAVEAFKEGKHVRETLKENKRIKAEMSSMIFGDIHINSPSLCKRIEVETSQVTECRVFDECISLEEAKMSIARGFGTHNAQKIKECMQFEKEWVEPNKTYTLKVRCRVALMQDQN